MCLYLYRTFSLEQAANDITDEPESDDDGRSLLQARAGRKHGSNLASSPWFSWWPFGKKKKAPAPAPAPTPARTPPPSPPERAEEQQPAKPAASSNSSTDSSTNSTPNS